MTATGANTRPLPLPDADSQGFWDACREHSLRAQRCSACGQFRWPPRELCPHCYSWEYAWATLPGGGTVASFTVVHYAVVPAFKERLPYVVADITLEGTDGRVTFTSNIVGCAPDDVRVGLPVQVVFDDITPDVTLPLFQPVESSP